MMTVGAGGIADGGERCDERKAVVSCPRTTPARQQVTQTVGRLDSICGKGIKDEF